MNEKNAGRRLLEALRDYLLGDGGPDEFNTVSEDVTGRPQASRLQPLRELLRSQWAVLDNLYTRAGATTGIPTGFRDLDETTGGLHRGDLVILAGRPANGKTSLALQIAMKAAIAANSPTLFLSNQMSGDDMALRLLCLDAQVRFSAFRTGMLENDDLRKLQKSQVYDAALHLDDSCRMSQADIEDRILRTKKALEPEGKSLDLMIIDALDSRTMHELQDGMVLKEIALKHGLCVLALYALGNQWAKGHSPRPSREDLWADGSMETHADLVLFIYRDEVYFENSPDSGLVQIDVLKNRYGALGALKLHFQPEFGQFEDTAEPVEMVFAGTSGPQTEATHKPQDVCFLHPDEPPAAMLETITSGDFRNGFTLDELLDDPALTEYQKEQIARFAGGGYRALAIGGIWFLKKADRFEWVDLGQLGTLFGPAHEKAARVLFDTAEDQDDGFSWQGLAGLLATDPENLSSWGDGTITNGHWLIRAPEARGLLGLEFLSASSGMNRGHEKYAWALDVTGFEEGTLTGQQDPTVVRVDPAGVLVSKTYLENILAALGASSQDLTGVAIYCKGARERVVFAVNGEPRAALMPMKW